MDNIDNVYQAFDCLSSQNTDQRHAADKWLLEFQRSIHAWSTCDKLLNDNERNYSATVFAAQTMRRKILMDFSELPQDSYDSLRDALINHLKRIEPLDPVHYGTVVTQLALALADLYLQVPEWIGFIGHIVNIFATGTPGGINIMLSLLTVFPEELQGRDLRLGANRREAVQAELAGNFNIVVNLLTQVLNIDQSNTSMAKKVLQCINVWVNNPQNKTEGFAASPLLQNMLQLLNEINVQTDIYQANCEAISSAACLAEDTRNHYQLALTLQQGIFSTAQTFQTLMASEDFDKLASLSRVYIELAESFLEEIVNHTGGPLSDLRTIELVLQIVNYHDYALVELTFNIWYRLSEFIFQVTEDVNYAALMDSFRPFIEKYILALHRHCQIDVDQDGILDEKDDFSQFRNAASDSIKDVSFIMGTIALLKRILKLIQDNPSITWSELESALFIVSAVVNNVTNTQEEALPDFLHIIFSLPLNSHVSLLNTGAEFMGSFPEWFEDRNELLNHSFRWLLSLCEHEELIKTTAESIDAICKIHYMFLREYFPALMTFLRSMERAHNYGPRMEQAAQAIIRSCAALLNDLPGADIVQQLEVLCSDSVRNLNELSNAHQNGAPIVFNEEVPDAWRKAKSDPLIWLDRITSVFKTLKPWNAQKAFQVEHARHNGTPAMLETIPELQVPWLELGRKIWNAISATIEAYQDSSRIVEHACRCSRYLIRSMGMQSVRFVNDLATLIVKVYDAHPHSCFLYLASVIVDEYAVFDSVLPYLLEMGGVIARRSFQLFAKPNGLRDNPDTVDDLFRLAIRFVQKSPAAFFSIEFSKELFQCGIHALEVDHSEAHRSVTKFFTETIEAVRMAKQAGGQYPALDAVELLFTQHGEELVWYCLSGALFFVSHPLRKDLGEVLFELNRVYPERFSNWLRNGILKLQQEHRLGATLAQLETYHARTVSASRQSEAVTALRDLCKFYS
uniref:Importin N-terminal domain-containing protein n=1 Tax=Panagrolaimus sp. ES5 TaxID=591445 RepID=A0AC34GR35_9BILA